MHDGEDLLGRAVAALLIAQARFRFRRRQRDRNGRPTGRIKKVVTGAFASGHERYQRLFRLAPAGSRR